MKKIVQLSEIIKRKTEEIREKERCLQTESKRKGGWQISQFPSLMNLSVSSIKQNQPPRQQLQCKRQQILVSVTKDVEEMRQKLNKIKSAEINVCKVQKWEDKNENRDYQFKNYLNRQLNREKIQKLVNSIKISTFRKFQRQIQVYSSLLSYEKNNQRQLCRFTFNCWKYYMLELSNKRRMVQYIREKLLQRRKQSN